jgi:hypothetical protein
MISNNPVSTVNAFALQGSRVTSTNFTNTGSATLVSAVPNREVLTVFNEGVGNLHISAGGNMHHRCLSSAFISRRLLGMPSKSNYSYPYGHICNKWYR